MSSFNLRKNIEDSLKDGLIISIKGIPRCYGYTKTYQWNLWRRAGERECSLQKMDQRVIQQKFYNPCRVIKLHDTDKESVCFVLLLFGPTSTSCIVRG